MANRTKRLRQQNNALDRKLSRENSKIMAEMVGYLKQTGISAYQREAARAALLKAVWSAQARGEKADAVMGADHPAFCEAVIENLPPRSARERILEGLDLLLLGMAGLCAIGLVFSKDTIALISNLWMGKPPAFQIHVSLGGPVSYVIFLAVAIGMIRRAGQTVYSPLPEHKKRRRKRILWGALMGPVLAGVFLLLAYLGQRPLFTIHLLWGVGLVALLFLAHKGIETYEKD